MDKRPRYLSVVSGVKTNTPQPKVLPDPSFVIELRPAVD